MLVLVVVLLLVLEVSVDIILVQTSNCGGVPCFNIFLLLLPFLFNITVELFSTVIADDVKGCLSPTSILLSVVELLLLSLLLLVLLLFRNNLAFSIMFSSARSLLYINCSLFNSAW